MCPAACCNRISRQKLLRRLRREIDTLRALDGCPSSIAFEGAFETDGHVYLIMEVCHGGDLETLLKVLQSALIMPSMQRWPVLWQCGAWRATVTSICLSVTFKAACTILCPGLLCEVGASLLRVKCAADFMMSEHAVMHVQACGALGERHAAMAVWEVLRLVRACHAAGILHGDIKPSNFMLAPGNPLCPGGSAIALLLACLCLRHMHMRRLCT